MKPFKRPLAIQASFLSAALAFSSAAMAGPADPLMPTGKWTVNSRGAAKTPPMGWSSWNAFRTDVTEAKVMGAAQALVDTGLAKLGYRYVNVDDGWWLKRRLSDGRLQIRTAIFPSAKTGGKKGTDFRPFVNRIHAMGLKAGIYTDVGRNACSQAFDLHSPNLPEGSAQEREVALHGHVEEDIRLFFREWGFDYVKIDACGIADYKPGIPLVRAQGYRGFEPLIERGIPNRTDEQKVRGLYERVADALARENPDNDYVLAITTWGEANVRSWGKNVGNLWRTSGDITPEWSRLLHNFDSTASRALYAQPGTWNDPDMLFIGAGEFDQNHLTEARSHFSLWSIINAPLLIGYDLRRAPKSLLDIWGNAEVVAVNQDPAGNQGVIAYDSDDLQIIVKTMSDPRRKAVAIFNRGNSPAKAALTASHLKFAGNAPIHLKNLWTKEAVAPFTGDKEFTLAPRETLMFMATGARELADGVYLSEIPGSVNVAVDGVIKPETEPDIHQMVDPWSGTRSTGSRLGYPGWGGAQADAEPYGGPLQVGGERFVSGVGILAGSRLEVRNAGYENFSASVGINDTSRATDVSAEFLVYGDGRLLARSEPVSFGSAPVRLKADVKGVRIVELVAKRLKPGSEPVSVTWGAAALTN